MAKAKRSSRELGEYYIKQVSFGMMARVSIQARLNQRKFLTAIILTVSVGLIVIVGIASYEFPSIGDGINLISLIVAVIAIGVSYWGITKAIESAIIEENYQRKVIMYPSCYTFDKQNILITAINIGDPLIVRETVLLVGWIEAGSFFEEMIKGNIMLHPLILGELRLRAGCELLDKSSIWRIPEENIRESLLKTAELYNENLKKYANMSILNNECPQVYLMIRDRFGEQQINNRDGKNKNAMVGLVSICNIGDYPQLLWHAQKSEPIKLSEIAINVYGDSTKGATPASIMQYFPPIAPSEEEVRAEELRILRSIDDKLDGIQQGRADKGKSKKP